MDIEKREREKKTKTTSKQHSRCVCDSFGMLGTPDAYFNDEASGWARDKLIRLDERDMLARFHSVSVVLSSLSLFFFCLHRLFFISFNTPECNFSKSDRVRLDSALLGPPRVVYAVTARDEMSGDFFYSFFYGVVGVCNFRVGLWFRGKKFDYGVIFLCRSIFHRETSANSVFDISNVTSEGWC